ncbi:MAG: 16S rRNA (cytosine(1402)-N(4))-methyltransferase, partial [Rhodospirillaceae bacterium]
MTHADPSAPHLSVMALEVLDALGLGPDAPHAEDGVFIDGTFGAGGYSRAMLQAGAGHLYGIDRDPSARSHAAPLQDSHPERFTFVAGRFGDMVALMDAQGLGQGSIAGIALDLGVSSMQLDQAERGFSFRQDGPLDMRMSATPAQDDAANKAAGQSAADLVNTLGEEDLANILYRL